MHVVCGDGVFVTLTPNEKVNPKFTALSPHFLPETLGKVLPTGSH